MNARGGVPRRQRGPPAAQQPRLTRGGSAATLREMTRHVPAKRLEFFFDYSCPYAYVASRQLPAIAARMGVTPEYRPFLLGGVFQARGTPQNLMNQLSPQKSAHNLADMARAAARIGEPLVVPAEHPRKTVAALRATIACDVDVRVVDGFFRAYWVEGRDPSAKETIADVVSAAGYDASDVLARIESQAVKDALRAATDEAVSRGVFGAPTFFVNGTELYWGQDRLHFVEGAPFVPGEDRSGSPSGRVVEAYWDYSSPFAYLGMSKVDEVARRAGATVVSRPMLLGGLFKTIGQVNVPMASWSAERQAYVMADMPRWAEYWGVPFTFPTRFPMNTIKALRATLAAPPALHRAIRDAIFRAYWAEDRDISDDAVLAALLAGVGADADEVLAATQAPEVKAELIAATQAAVERGVFGAPTFFVDGELYWGQDRLDLVDGQLRASADAR